MLVISRIATSARSTSRHGTRPAQPSPAKITASEARSSHVSSRRPAADATPYARAIPPSMPSSTCPNAMRASPQPRRPAPRTTPAVAHRDMDTEEQARHHAAENHAQRHDPQQRHRLLQRRAPVVTPFVSQPHGADVERRLDDVVDVDTHAEGVGEHLVAPLEPHRLDAQRGDEEVREDRHGVAAPADATRRRPDSQTRPTPTPIHARSRTRLTMAV